VFTSVNLLLLAALLLGIPSMVSAQDPVCYRVATAAGVGATGEMAEITRHVFARAGLCVEMVRLPSKRIGAMAEQGEVDGWVQAVASDEVSKGLFLVSHDLGRLAGGLYWSPSLPEPKGGGAIIGVVLGQKWAQDEVHRRGAILYEVRDNKQLLTMVSKGHIQGFLIPDVTYRHFLVIHPELADYRSLAVADLRIRLALNVGLKPLEERLNAAIDQTIAEGFPAKVWRNYLEELRNPGDQVRQFQPGETSPALR